jgi:hypothetical protein
MPLDCTEYKTKYLQNLSNEGDKSRLRERGLLSTVVIRGYAKYSSDKEVC